jgi:hypothetical protein
MRTTTHVRTEFLTADCADERRYRSCVTEAERGGTELHSVRRDWTLWNSVQPLAWLCDGGFLR